MLSDIGMAQLEEELKSKISAITNEQIPNTKYDTGIQTSLSDEDARVSEFCTR